MTLLVGYASPEFAILASDRMITWTTTRRVKGREQTTSRTTESTVKATFFAGQYLIGFSGVADLGGETEKWLVEHLSGLVGSDKLGQWREYLVQDLKAELRRLNRHLPVNNWISLLVVGYGRDRESGEIVQVLQTISNDRYPLRLGAHASSEPERFRSAWPSVEVPGEEFRFWAVGNVPSTSELGETVDAIRSYRKRNPGLCRGIVGCMARLIVRRADSPNVKGVGRNVQVAVMPRSALGGQYSFGEFSEPLRAVTSVEVNPTALTSDGTLIISGINMVSLGGQVVTDAAIAFGSSVEIGPREPFARP